MTGFWRRFKPASAAGPKAYRSESYLAVCIAETTFLLARDAGALSVEAP